MGDESVNLQTNNLLGTGSRSPLLRLRREDKDSNNRRSGMIFDEDFQVTADQREADEELTKQVYSGMYR